MSEAARNQFVAFTERTDQLSDAELDEFWSTLLPITIEEMMGEWKGGEFFTGHRGNGLMAQGNWYGKTFISADDVKPLICLDENGEKFSNKEWMNGEASVWLEEFRGELTATMVYDGVPIHDHFKKVDETTVLGIMNGKAALDYTDGKGRYLYFYLQRV